MRIIKPAFFRDLDMAALPIPTRLTYIGLWTYVDDYGNGIDDARLVKAEVWPLDDSYTSKKVQNDLDRLVAAGRIVRYETGGKRYLSVPKWKEHQKISHPSPSTVPQPQRDSGEIPESFRSEPEKPPDISEPLPNDSGPRVTREELELGKGNMELGSGKRETCEASDDAESFRTFWEIWRRKIDKADAEKAWRKIDRTEHDAVIEGARRWDTYWHKSNTEQKFIPHPATWLNKQRWTSNPPAVTAGSNAVASNVDTYRARLATRGIPT